MFLQKLFENLPKDATIEIRGKDRRVKPPQIRRLFTRNLEVAEAFAKLTLSEEGFEAYVGVAARKSVASDTSQKLEAKESFHSTRALWVDLDGGLELLVNAVLPPTAIVLSGTPNHAHCYWFVQTPITDITVVENLNKLLCKTTKQKTVCADGVHILRVPGTLNYKDPDLPTPVELMEFQPDRIYTIEDIQAIAKVKPSTLLRLQTEAPVGSRSEADWACIGDLIDAGFSDQAIYHIYEAYPVGEKARESGERYLDITLQNCRKHKAEQQAKALKVTIVDHSEPPPAKKEKKKSADHDAPEDVIADLEGSGFTTYWDIGMAKNDVAYFRINKDGTVSLLSSFLIKVDALLNPDDNLKVDTFIVSVMSNGFTWDKVLLPTNAFDSSAEFKRRLTKAAWSWFGSDKETIQLRHILTQEWLAAGKPQMLVSNQIGRRIGVFKKTQYDVVIGDTETLNSNGLVENEMIFTSQGRTHPVIRFDQSKPSKEVMAKIVNNLVLFNTKQVTMTTLGWWLSAIYKPVLQTFNVHFPHLQIFGSRGSGKSQTIASILQPLVCFAEPQTHPAAATPFVMMTLLGGSTTTPVCLTEYRASTILANSRFPQLLRVAYDNGQEARGKQDLSTETFLLSSPICIDGEEPLTDAALLERTLPVYMNVEDLNINDPASPNRTRAFQNLQRLPLRAFGTQLMLFSMKQDAFEIYELALASLAKVKESAIPPRILSNMAVSIMGIITLEMFCEHLEIPCPFHVTEENVAIWFSSMTKLLLGTSGRTSLIVDSFVEDVVNAITGMVYGTLPQGLFFYRYDPEEPNVVAFHLKTAYNWWRSARPRSSTDDTVEHTTVMRMLKELTGTTLGKYIREPKPAKTSNSSAVQRMYFVDLPRAVASGLDVSVTPSKPIPTPVVTSEPSESAAKLKTAGGILINFAVGTD